MKESQKQFFNQIAETWNAPIQNIMIAEEVINRLGIQAKHSIPHFNNLYKVFQNAYNALKDGGKFVIVHCRTREGLKQHHINIEYSASKQHPIPLDAELIDECMAVGFKEVIVEDEKYFYFEAAKI